PDDDPQNNKQHSVFGNGEADNAGTNNESVGGEQQGRPCQNKEVRGNNTQNSEEAILALSKSYSPLSYGSQCESSGNGTGNKAFDAAVIEGPIAQTGVSMKTLSPITSEDCLWTRSTSPEFTFDLGKGAQHSPERQTQRIEGWTIFAAGGVKEDDSQRQELAAAEAKLEIRQRLAEASLIEFEDMNDVDGKEHSRLVKGETVVEMRNGRKWFTKD